MTDYADIKDAAGALEVFNNLDIKNTEFLIYLSEANAMQRDKMDGNIILGLLTLAAEAMIPEGLKLSINQQDSRWAVTLWQDGNLDPVAETGHPLRCMACLMEVEKIDE